MPKSISELEKNISDELKTFAETEYSTQLITALLSRDYSSYVSIPVNGMSVFSENSAFSQYMFENPKRALNILEESFRKVSLSISKNHVLKADMVYKENVHVRLLTLPNIPELNRAYLPDCSDVGQFLCISGTVVRSTTARSVEYKKQWRCSKCKYQFCVEAEVELGYTYEKPTTCLNPDWCKGKKFTLLSTDINTKWCKDYQEIILQEKNDSSDIGSVPRSMTVILEDDLVESCFPGNDIITSGILIQRWKLLEKGAPMDIELVFLAHNIEVQNKMSSTTVSKAIANEFAQFWQNQKSNPLKARNFILLSVCPQVFGLYIVKLAAAVVLAGGVERKDGNTRIRGDSHLLLVGDPGTAKTQFLKFGAKVSQKCVMTSGIGTTNAGLTASAIKENGRWQLEAGALALADGGVCCIDEFSRINEHDKTCIHEAMEQQTISVAKAGLVCTLKSRCSILAAANSKGKYDENMSISGNTAIGRPLLSRFDIILVLLNTNEEKWDDMVSSYILGGRDILRRHSTLWSTNKMKDYFTLIQQIKPKVTKAAETVLHTYYSQQRNLHPKNESRNTPRLLQSLVRLAEGHARLMFRNEVLVSDAIVAITLMESSMLGDPILEGASPLNTTFPKDPVAEYEDKANCVLRNLNLNLPIEENNEKFYQESNIRKMFFGISEILTSKDKRFIFKKSQKNVSDISELGENSDYMNNETTYESKDFIDESLFPQPMDISVNVNNNFTIEAKCASPKNIFGNFQATYSNKKIKHNDYSEKDYSLPIATNKLNNMSILSQILEEEDISENNSALFTNLNKPNLTTSNIKNNLETTGSKDTSYKKCEISTKNISSINKCGKCGITQCDRNNLLQEMGISPPKISAKKADNDANNPQAGSSNCNKVNTTLPFVGNTTVKKSLADQLKNIAFSKRRMSSQNYCYTSKNQAKTLSGADCNSKPETGLKNVQMDMDFESSSNDSSKKLNDSSNNINIVCRNTINFQNVQSTKDIKNKNDQSTKEVKHNSRVAEKGQFCSIDTDPLKQYVFVKKNRDKTK